MYQTALEQEREYPSILERWSQRFLARRPELLTHLWHSLRQHVAVQVHFDGQGQPS